MDEQKDTTQDKTTQAVSNNKQGDSTSEFEKLKAQNDEFEKELIKAREMRAEMQKLEAEKLLAGTAGGHVEPVVKELTAKEYADAVMKNTPIIKDDRE